MSWITAILQLYRQVAELFGNVIVKRINIRLFDLLARFHYILNLPRTLGVNTNCPTYQQQSNFLWRIGESENHYTLISRSTVTNTPIDKCVYAITVNDIFYVLK